MGEIMVDIKVVFAPDSIEIAIKIQRMLNIGWELLAFTDRHSGYTAVFKKERE
jgi:hypothetical protein